MDRTDLEDDEPHADLLRETVWSAALVGGVLVYLLVIVSVAA